MRIFSKLLRSPAQAGVQESQKLRSRLWVPASAGTLSRERESGFTLIELMVVIAILAILTVVVAINVIPSGEKAKATKAKVDISNLESALNLYKLNYDSYPTTAQGLQALVTAPAGVDASKYQKGGYIQKLPPDPWGRPYLYASPGQHGEADVWTLGADGKEGGEGAEADIGSWQ